MSDSVSAPHSFERYEKNTAFFTGHRFITSGHRERLSRRLIEQIYLHYYRGMDHFMCGGALGFDTLAAQSVLKLRDEDNLPIYLVLALPCENQTAKWPNQSDIDEYYRILSLSDEVIYISEEYDSTCMMRRNRFMVDSSSACVAYLRQGTFRSGTLQTYRMAEAKGIPIMNLALPDEKPVQE